MIHYDWWIHTPWFVLWGDGSYMLVCYTCGHEHGRIRFGLKLPWSKWAELLEVH